MDRSSISARLAPALLLAFLAAAPLPAAHPPAPRGVGGAVASSEVQATAAGLEILRRGGNAVDAAVATALALAVVHPQAGNLGGGGFAVVRMDGRVATLDFRETAPAGASRGMFTGPGGEPLGERSLVGPLAAGVPGSPAGLHALHARYGALPWPTVVAPALRLASAGFVVSERLARSLVEHRELLARFPETAEVWLPGGEPPEAGTVVRLPGLAALLRRYAERGPEAVTGGPAAAAIELVSRRYGGVLRATDLAAYTPVWRDPVRFRAWGWEVASMDLPSSGGLILAETAGILERSGWSDAPRFGAVQAHLLAEAWRRAFADRFRLGDPRTTEATARELLAPAWIRRRAGEIRTDRATPSDQVTPWPGTPLPESPETTHLSVADAHGNVVALTTTLNGDFGCGLLVPGLDLFLNNEMDDFTTAPGRPNQFGLVQGEANTVAPGKRMLSSMSPTVLWRGPEVVALGSPGGSRIPTATLQVMLNLVVFGDPLQAAVDRPRIHHQWRPDRIDAERDALSPETLEALRGRGHTVLLVPSLGEVNAVRVLGGGWVEAAADPRGGGAAGVAAEGRSAR